MGIRNFSLLRNIDDLARELGCERKDVEKYTASGQRRFYKERRIPKKGRRRRGQFRVVYKPERTLGILQKNIASAISNLIEFPPYVQGFVSKRSIITNARIHVGQKILLHADIQNFFESISLARVQDAFTQMGSNLVVAKLLAQLCTLDGFLPQGSSASPVLANLVCQHLDLALDRLASSQGCKYSRYADDITISGQSVPSHDSIGSLLKKYGFKMREDSCRTQRRGHGTFVTGLSVEGFGDADDKPDDESEKKPVPRVPRRMKRRLRLVLHHLEGGVPLDKIQVYPKLTVMKINGWISFINAVEPKLAAKLLERWAPILEKIEGAPKSEDRSE